MLDGGNPETSTSTGRRSCLNWHSFGDRVGQACGEAVCSRAHHAYRTIVRAPDLRCDRSRGYHETSASAYPASDGQRRHCVRGQGAHLRGSKGGDYRAILDWYSLVINNVERLVTLVRRQDPKGS